MSNRKLRWASHVRRMDWSRLPRKLLTSWVDAPGCRGRAHSYGHDLTRELQLIGFNTDRAAVQLGVSLSSRLSWGAVAQDREKWRKLAARLPLAPDTVGTKLIAEQTRTERTQSERAIAQPAPDPAATTWSQRLRSTGPAGRRGTIPYHTIPLQVQSSLGGNSSRMPRDRDRSRSAGARPAQSPRGQTPESKLRLRGA
jgi:hypothetical protein